MLKQFLMVCWGLCLALCAWGQEPLHAALRETVHRVDVEVTDLYGKTVTQPVVITVFRPEGEVPAPLLILNHGRAAQALRHVPLRQRYVEQAKYFVAKGFVVMVPTRIGYGETVGAIDPEDSDACRNTQLSPKDTAVFKQIMAVVDFATTQPYVDARQWVVAGQSLGGYISVVTTRKAPPGLVGGINFAGGFGGDPDGRRANPCGALAWARALSVPMHTSTPPMLWVYWNGDRYWGDSIPQQWFAAYQVGGGVGELHQLPALKVDGHGGFARDIPGWMPVVDQFLSKLPLPLNAVAMPARMQAPPATSFAPLASVESLPYVKASGREGYRKFLNNPNQPRAFALNPDGKWAYLNGYTDAMARALDVCNTGAKKPCQLYAVDDDVVWKED